MTNINDYNLVEIKGDLFSSDYSIGHCVSADLRMSQGIAKIFKEKFGRIDTLRGSGVDVGGISTLCINGRWIYYLITKRKFHDKPLYSDIESALLNMKLHAELNDVRNIDLPKIGCGLDKMVWDKVKMIIKSVFCDSNIKIRIFHL